MHLWTEISISHARNYQSFFKRRNTVSQQNHLCRASQRGTSITKILAGILRAAGSASNPRRWYGSSQSSLTDSMQTSELRSAIHGTQATNTRTAPKGYATGNQQAVQTGIDIPQLKELYVLFGVKGTRRTLDLAQINASKYTNDCALFGVMRRQYRELRGFLRYWFSIWRFSHCDFVKVHIQPVLTSFHMRA